MGDTFQDLGYSSQSVAGLYQGSGENLECVRIPSMNGEQLDNTVKGQQKQRELLGSVAGLCDWMGTRRVETKQG